MEIDMFQCLRENGNGRMKKNVTSTLDADILFAGLRANIFKIKSKSDDNALPLLLLELLLSRGLEKIFERSKGSRGSNST